MFPLFQDTKLRLSRVVAFLTIKKLFFFLVFYFDPPLFAWTTTVLEYRTLKTWGECLKINSRHQGVYGVRGIRGQRVLILLRTRTVNRGARTTELTEIHFARRFRR